MRQDIIEKIRKALIDLGITNFYYIAKIGNRTFSEFYGTDLADEKVNKAYRCLQNSVLANDLIKLGLVNADQDKQNLD